MDSKEQTPSFENGKPVTTITQISRPFFTHAEISYLHGQTIEESKKLSYNQIKNQIFTLLYQVIKQLKFPLRVLGTTMNYYQRFYLFHKFVPDSGNEDPFIVAMSCLLLASKNEDCIKKLKDIQSVVNKLRDIDENKLVENPENTKETIAVVELQRKLILATEFKLLQLIKFDFSNGANSLSIRTSVDCLLVQFCKQLDINYRMSSLCWLICFDIMSTPLCLVIPPHCIAVSIIIISLNLKFKDLKLIHHEIDEDKDDEKLSAILDSLDCERDFKTPEVLVNEGILYILDYYIHQYNYSILNNYLPDNKKQQSRFMELKEKFIDLKNMNEVSCKESLNKTDEYLNKWEFNNKGIARFMLGNKRRRFNKELNN
ncbi:CTD kinase subunit beta [Spathaspora sp. JA1]|nr:CTD kinase subunit beta [Spathaspora sp. JA1]